MTLRFDQLKALTLTTPLLPLPLPLADPHAELLSQRQSSPYVVHLVEGGELKGQTIGHVETDFGLFLFPPLENDGSVKRMFVPACAFKSFEIGKKIGEVLIEDEHATWDQVTDAMDLQDEMRHKKIGDILVTKQIVLPDQLLEAIERQHKMPMVRIGEALLSLGIVSNGQLNDALLRSSSSTAACRSAKCWCAWAWYRATTCRPPSPERWAIRSSISTPSRPRPRPCAR